MAKGGSINFDVGFNVNKKSLESLKKELQDIQSLTAKQIAPKVGTSNAQSELNKIKKSASELQEALKRAFNPQINSLNVAKFNEQIQSGKINLQQMAQNFSKLGAQGENAFGGLINSTLTANTQLKQTNQLLASAKESLANTVRWKISSSIVNSITNILMIIIWLTTAIIIINKTNFPDERVSKKRNKNNKYLVVTIILSFLLMFVPFERIIPGYEKNIICYTFKTTTPLELYTAHIPSYETYKISLTREDPTYVVNDKGEVSLSKTYNNYELYFTEEDGELYLVNKNTSQKYNLGYTDVTNIEILKNNDVYLIVIVSDYNDGTIYYSNYITDYNLSNDKNYLEDVSYSFIEYAVPNIDKLGYITFEYNLEKKIPYLLSEDGKEFIIKNGELFLIE